MKTTIIIILLLFFISDCFSSGYDFDKISDDEIKQQNNLTRILLYKQFKKSEFLGCFLNWVVPTAGYWYADCWWPRGMYCLSGIISGYILFFIGEYNKYHTVSSIGAAIIFISYTGSIVDVIFVVRNYNKKLAKKFLISIVEINNNYCYKIGIKHFF